LVGHFQIGPRARQPVSISNIFRTQTVRYIVNV